MIRSAGTTANGLDNPSHGAYGSVKSAGAPSQGSGGTSLFAPLLPGMGCGVGMDRNCSVMPCAWANVHAMRCASSSASTSALGVENAVGIDIDEFEP